MYRVRVADHKVERAASLKGFRRAIFAWTPWSGLTPDGAGASARSQFTGSVCAGLGGPPKR